MRELGTDRSPSSPSSQALAQRRAPTTRPRASARTNDVAALDFLRSGLAVVTGRVTLRGIWRGQDFTGQYQVSATWVNERGRWRLLAIHSSRIADRARIQSTRPAVSQPASSHHL